MQTTGQRVFGTPVIRTACIGVGLFVALSVCDILLPTTVLDGGAAGGVWTSSARADDDDDDGGGRRRGGFSGGGGGFSLPRLPGLPAFGIPVPRFGSPSRPRRAAAPAPEAIRREWIAAGVNDSDVTRLRAAGFTIVAERRLALLPEITVRLRAPRNLSDRAAQDRLRALIPSATLDRNHLYRASARPCPAANCFPYTGPRAADANACRARGTIGMIDTGVDPSHPALANVIVETDTLLGPGHQPARSTHGTDVAILIAAGTSGSDFRLTSIDAFHRRGRGASADAFDIIAALDRMSAKAIRVVNLSFAGPPNILLRDAGAAATTKGMLVVAAAGNDGPSSPPRYPAAYDWAVAVTAVDRHDAVYARAVRGHHIAFAAPGVRLQMPDAALRPGPLRSGTSYAAPVVTSVLSARLASAGDPKISDIVSGLASAAKDLGAPGRDPVFGFGLVTENVSCQTAQRSAAPDVVVTRSGR